MMGYSTQPPLSVLKTSRMAPSLVLPLGRRSRTAAPRPENDGAVAVPRGAADSAARTFAATRPSSWGGRTAAAQPAPRRRRRARRTLSASPFSHPGLSLSSWAILGPILVV